MLFRSVNFVLWLHLRVCVLTCSADSACHTESLQVSLRNVTFAFTGEVMSVLGSQMLMNIRSEMLLNVAKPDSNSEAVNATTVEFNHSAFNSQAVARDEVSSAA